MKRIMDAARLVILILAVAEVAKAQAHTVYFPQSDDETQEVLNVLRAKVGASSRYVIGELYNVELVPSIVCFKIAGNGFVCNMHVDYHLRTDYHTGEEAFILNLGGGLGRGATAESMAEHLFEAFVSYTSDDKIKLAGKQQMDRLRGFCGKPENKKQCQP